MLKNRAFLVSFALLVTVGCSAIGNTGQTSSDAAAVQRFFPSVNGYNVTTVDNIANAISTVIGGANLATGNILGAGAISKLESMRTCYQNVGAVDARVYTRVAVPPIIGAVVIINRDRVIENFVSCAVGASGFDAGAGAPTEPQPCVNVGNFSAEGDNFDYMYVATDQALCNEFSADLSQYPPAR